MRAASQKQPTGRGSAAAVSFDLTQTLKKNGTYTVTVKDYYGNKRSRPSPSKDTKADGERREER